MPTAIEYYERVNKLHAALAVAVGAINSGLAITGNTPGAPKRAPDGFDLPGAMQLSGGATLIAAGMNQLLMDPATSRGVQQTLRGMHDPKISSALMLGGALLIGAGSCGGFDCYGLTTAALGATYIGLGAVHLIAQPALG